jgi:hypothetical protein
MIQRLKRLKAENRRDTALGENFFRGNGISYFSLIPKHAAMRMMSCLVADFRKWSSTLLRSFTVSNSAIILVPHT